MPSSVDAERAEVVGKSGRGGGLHHRVGIIPAAAEYQQGAAQEDLLEQQLKL